MGGCAGITRVILPTGEDWASFDLLSKRTDGPPALVATSTATWVRLPSLNFELPRVTGSYDHQPRDAACPFSRIGLRRSPPDSASGTSEKVQELQRKRLGTAAELAQWAPTLDESPPVAGCVLANEVLDNFPFHRLP